MASKQKRLERARKLRRKISLELNALASGRIDCVSVLESPSTTLGHVSVRTLLMRTPKLGEEGVKKILMSAHVWPETRLANLTPSEVAAIIERLPPRVTGA